MRGFADFSVNILTKHSVGLCAEFLCQGSHERPDKIASVRRAQEIDRICQDLCGNQAFGRGPKAQDFGRGPKAQAFGRGPKAQPTIAAFGAANACSTGFGYAPGLWPGAAKSTVPASPSRTWGEGFAAGAENQAAAPPSGT